MTKVTLLAAMLAVTAMGATMAPAQRSKAGAGADPYAAANNHTLDMKPIGSHSRSRSLADLVAMGALTKAEAAQRLKSEAWGVTYSQETR